MKRLIQAFSLVTIILAQGCGQKQTRYDPQTLATNLTATDALIKFAAPNDLDLAFTHQQIEWQLADYPDDRRKSLTVAADQAITLLLNPSSYRFFVQLLNHGTIVASSQWASCQNHQQIYTLTPGANKLPLILCTKDGKAGLIENRAHYEQDQTAPSYALIPNENQRGFALSNVDAEYEEINDAPGEPQANPTVLADHSVQAKVLLFGDAGTGGDDQRKVAQAMLNFCDRQRCDYGLMLGDNIYENGVASPDDPQFKTKFEDMYRPLGIPFYVALGNHDVRNHAQGIQGQIAYSNISDIWHMDDRYFKVRLDDIEYFIIDTNTFSVDPQQKAWLKVELKESEANWKVVFGHHPIYTVGSHGMSDFLEGFPLKRLGKALEPLMCKYGVDFYLSGHDHHLEVNRSSCGVVHILSGAAAKTRETYWWLKLFNQKRRLYSIGDTLGFAHLEFYEHQALLRLIDGDGKQLFKKIFPHRLP